MREKRANNRSFKKSLTNTTVRCKIFSTERSDNMYSFSHMIRNASNMDVDLLSAIIINKIKIELVSKITYDLNVALGNYNTHKLDELLDSLRNRAKDEKIELNIDVDNLLIFKKELNIRANYVDDMFLKFMIMERYFYKRIKYNTDSVLDFKQFDLNRLYTLHALKTAYYEAGVKDFYVRLNNKNHKLKASNMASRYYNKIITMEEVKYSKKIEEQRKENMTKHLVKKK